MNTYYFGCWSPQRLGHYLYTPDGRRALRDPQRELPVREDVLDGGLLAGIPDVPGHAVLFHGRGWTLLSFWDRSGDARPNSTSTFVLRGDFTFAQALAQAQQAFPARWALLQVPVREYDPPAGAA